MKTEYELVIGLETHVELATKTKIFCGCPTSHGAPPNTHCCPVCMGLPGTLPVLNQAAVELAVRAGLCLHCGIAPRSVQERKNYFYPDLPKAYQISQLEEPVCGPGWLEIETPDGTKRIGITRAHIEEDAGKLMHDSKGETLVDYNRCGVPLLEIVSEPELRSPAEARAYLTALRDILLAAGVSDCKMNEGSMRCDVNVSIRPKGKKALGVRAEIKNLNSLAFVEKAIAYEYSRQIHAREAGEEIVQETRRFDETSGKTFSMRGKEDADDYRYFPDPDLPPVIVTPELIERERQRVPASRKEQAAALERQYSLPAAQAKQFAHTHWLRAYFEECAAYTQAFSPLAELVCRELPRAVQPEEPIPIPPRRMAALAGLLQARTILPSAARQVLAALCQEDFDPAQYVEEKALSRITDERALEEAVLAVLDGNPQAALDYRAGKQAALSALIGKAVAKTQGRGDPALLRELLLRQLGGRQR